jgi:glucosyl-3-phosphoglycerate synthase
VTRDEWLARRTYRGADFDPEQLAHQAQRDGLRISVCLPALNVSDTIGPIVDSLRRRLMNEIPLLCEIVVMDGSSSDGTRRVAEQAGARVVLDHEVLPRLAPGHGKGEAMWKSLAVLSGDLVVWLDADVVDFDPAFVSGLLGPLLADPEVGYVKALYRRALGTDDDDGGRVTEICARPLINLFYPELAGFAQPLSGEAAGRRDLLRSVPFFNGYAVEIGLLIDLCRLAGLGALAQVDLGSRRHTNQPTAALGAMASSISQAVLKRVAQEGRGPHDLAGDGAYARPVRGEDGYVLSQTRTRPQERPPMTDVSPQPETVTVG